MIAPFHVLASEGAVHNQQPHGWHLDEIGLAAAEERILIATEHRIVDLAKNEEIEAATEWWTTRTAAGSEGMVVKLWGFTEHGERGVIAPALKCRGQEYLRIIYGPDYDAPQNLERLRRRHTRGKRMLALREFALGIEALDRFVGGRPLREVHAAVFGVLALEAEPADPRL